MKYPIAVLAALVAFPAAASEGHHCGLHDANGSWVYYSVAGSPSAYTLACSFNIASGTISGMCESSGGQSFSASGSLTVANAMDRHGDHHIQHPLNLVDRSACTITGQILYPDLTETLTNLTFTQNRDELIGVGTYGTGLLSATFVRTR
jgi:hypothetical protein